MKFLAMLVACLLAPAGCVLAQSLSLAEDFAEGFLYHGIFATNRSTDSDGTVVYRENDDSKTMYATVRQSAGDACVFVSTRFSQNAGVGERVPYREATYNLRGVSFASDRKHELAPKDGTYLILNGPRVFCEVATAGGGSKPERRDACRDTYEGTIEATMFATFERTAARLRGLCGWK